MQKIKNFTLAVVMVCLNGFVLTTLDIGFTNNALWLDDGSQHQYQNNPYIDHIALGFPVLNQKWGMSFGILPYSRRGYDYTSNINDSIAGSITFLNKGDGGLNKIYWGNGFKIKIDSNSFVSLGANANFVFGATTTDEKIVYGNITNGFNIWKKYKSSTADFGFDFGLQYQKSFSKYNAKTDRNDVYKLTLGTTYILASDLKNHYTDITRSFTGTVDFGTVKDTISFIDNASGVTQLPSQYGVGFALEKENKWLFIAEYKSSDWGKINSNSSVYSYQSTNTFSSGFEFTPKYNAYTESYFKRVVYRIGARYTDSYININNEKMNEYGITFGVRLPLKRTITSIPGITLGLEYGQRGKTGNGLIKETFLNFNVGITINDKWFRKNKYD